jgi:hypothetical protein
MKVILYDRTCVRTRGRLSPIWATGARLYRRLRRVDAVTGVASWSEAFTWLTAQREPIREIQYWGHGKWGSALVGDDVLDHASMAGQHRDGLAAVRERLAADALVWFRTCETLGAHAGHDFAQRFADLLGARVAGHTYVIGFHQSGLHGLAPGMRPCWSADEGLAEGTAAQPQRAKWSHPWEPRTITCLSSSLPRWFALDA